MNSNSLDNVEFNSDKNIVSLDSLDSNKILRNSSGNSKQPFTLPYSKTTGKIKLLVHVINQFILGYKFYKNVNSTNWYLVPLFMYIAKKLADLAGGIAHYSLDNYGFIDKVTAVLPGAPFIAQYVSHHDFPNLILDYDFWTTNSDGLYATSIVLTITNIIFSSSNLIAKLCQTYLASYLPNFINIAASYLHSEQWNMFNIALLPFWMIFLFGTGLTNQFHKWSHIPNPNIFLKTLQKLNLLLSYKEHHRHHTNPAVAYCLTTGENNTVLEKIKFWNVIDYIITGIFGKEYIEKTRQVPYRVEYIKTLL